VPFVRWKFNDKVEYYDLSILFDNNILRYFQGETDEYWKDIEPKGKKFMIIAMEEGNFVRNAGKQGEELSASDVNKKFPILNGIDYKSKNNKDTLIYMEV
jgi:hypothetical protein